MIGGTNPQLTHMGNPWLFRFRPNNTYSARVIADYGVKTLDKKKWAIVHTTDAFGTSGMKNLVEALKGAWVLSLRWCSRVDLSSDAMIPKLAPACVDVRSARALGGETDRNSLF